MENVKHLFLFAINYPFVAKTFNRQKRNISLRMLAQKYLYRNNFVLSYKSTVTIAMLT